MGPSKERPTAEQLKYVAELERHTTRVEFTLVDAYSAEAPVDVQATGKTVFLKTSEGHKVSSPVYLETNGAVNALNAARGLVQENG